MESDGGNANIQNLVDDIVEGKLLSCAMLLSLFNAKLILEASVKGAGEEKANKHQVSC